MVHHISMPRSLCQRASIRGFYQSCVTWNQMYLMYSFWNERMWANSDRIFAWFCDTQLGWLGCILFAELSPCVWCNWKAPSLARHVRERGRERDVRSIWSIGGILPLSYPTRIHLTLRRSNSLSISTSMATTTHDFWNAMSGTQQSPWWRSCTRPTNLDADCVRSIPVPSLQGVLDQSWLEETLEPPSSSMRGKKRMQKMKRCRSMSSKHGRIWANNFDEFCRILL